MKDLCNSLLHICGVLSTWVLICIAVLAGVWAYRTQPHKALQVAGRIKAPVVWGSVGVVCLILVLIIKKGTDPGLAYFFQNNQVTLLALVIALAAYTSGVAQKLREAIGRNDGVISDHLRNLLWLHKSDITLVLTGIALIIRIAAWSLGYRDEGLDRIIIGLLAWVIFYFALLHGIQLWLVRNQKAFQADKLTVDELHAFLKNNDTTDDHAKSLFEALKTKKGWSL